LLVALVLIPLEIILPLAWLLRPEDGIDIGLGLGLPAVMLPLLAFALTMLWIYYGAVALTQDGVWRY
jgi:16S rRNA G527 N7-methylase RsmG